MWHTKQKQQQQHRHKRQTFWDSMKLTNDFIWRPPSQLIDQQQQQQQQQRKADVKLLRPNSRTFKKRFYLSFDTRFNKNDHASNQHSTLREQVQSIDQLFWAKQRRLDANCRQQQHQFPTTTSTNVKMNLKRVEQINNRSKQNDKWQQNVKAKVVAPLQERNNNNNNSTTSYDYGDNNNNNNI